MIALLVGLVSTLFMTGLVWFVQVVAYPLLGQVPEVGYREYQRRHMVRTLSLVTVPMVLEGASGLALLAGAVPGVRGAAALAFALSLLIWGCTLTHEAPLHFLLLSGFSPAAHARLVRANWIRTAAWTARSALLVWMLVHATR